MNMYQFLEQVVREVPSNVFLTREGTTYGEFLELVNARAVNLQKKYKVQPGDTVGILAHNIPEFPLSYFAILAAGGRVLMLDTNLTPYEYENMTKIVNCKLILAEKSFFFESKNFKFHDITEKDPALEKGFVFKPYEAASCEIASLSFTSGSTGMPKVVPLTHFNLVETANSLEDMSEYIHHGACLYGFLPMYHVYGFAVEILATLHYRANILLQPGMNPKDIMADFKQYRPHVIPAVPRLWEVFYNKIVENYKAKHMYGVLKFILKSQKFLKAMGLGFVVRKLTGPVHDLFGGRVRLLIAGGAATKPEIELFYTRLGFGFIQGYGLTETVGPICISKPTKHRKPFSIGGSLSNNECQIRNKNNEGVGELWVRGHSVFKGYLDNELANSEVFDKDGWFNTGDLAVMDEKGDLFFRGRKKQVIVLDSGKNVYPDELEALYMEIPGVENVAVFEHKVKNKTVSYGVFQVKPDVTLEQLGKGIAKQNMRVASYKWVTHYAMTNDELPQTSTKKVKHHEVRKMLEKGEYSQRKE